jgi:hypothetical protein
MKTLRCLSAILVILVAAAVSPAQSTESSGPSAALSPQMEAALRGLTADDFAQRQQASAQIRSIMIEETRRMAATDDPESAARIAALLHFSAGLSEWVASAMPQPAKQRNELLAWGLDPAHRDIVAGAFSQGAEGRIAAARQLARITDAPAQELLTRLLRDPERAVYLAAMEALWDQPPSATVIDVLLDRAYAAGCELYHPVRTAQPNLTFRGQPLPAAVDSGAVYRRMQDSNVAVQLLAHFKSPLVGQRLMVSLGEQMKGQMNPFWPPGSDNFASLIDGLGAKQMVPVLYKLATLDDAHNQTSSFGGAVHGIWSPRMLALGMLANMTGQKPEDYKLLRHPSYQRLWLVPTEADEAAAVKQLQAWWKVHHAEYDAAAPSPAGTRPGPAVP